jgi:hypothetical protein
MSAVEPPEGMKASDFETIEAAVMETTRGRWFLAEFARRLRAADTHALMQAVERLERRMDAATAAGPLSARLMGGRAQHIETQAQAIVSEAPPLPLTSSESPAPAIATASLPPVAPTRPPAGASLSAIEALSRLSAQDQASLTA